MKNSLNYFLSKQNDAACKEYIDASKEIVKKYGLSIDILKRRKTALLRLQGDMIVTESIGRIGTCAELDAFLRIDIYLPVINKAINELNRRFSGENLAIFRIKSG